MSADGDGLRERLAALGRGHGDDQDASGRAAALLEDRRARLARRNLAPEHREVVAQAVLVRRLEQVLAVRLDAAEAVREVELVAFPGCTDVVTGLIHVRGRCLALVDLARYYGRAEPALHGARGLALVVGSGDEQVGLAIDEVVAVRAIHVDEIEAKVPRTLPFVSDAVRGGIDLVDVPALLAMPELRPV